MVKRDLPQKYRTKLRRPHPGEERYRKPPPIRITDKDIQILDLVFIHRILSSKMLYSLVEGKEDALRRRLQLLWLHRYLDRPPSQRVLQIEGGRRHLVYALGDRGAAILAKEKGYGIQNIRWRKKNQVKAPYLEHGLLISQIYTCLELALRKRPGVKLVGWRQGKRIEYRIEKPSTVESRQIRTRKPILRPDAFFVISRGGGKEFFFLEADRGTVREKTMLKRYREYWGLWKQKRFVKAGIPKKQGFRVLTVTGNPVRAENLRALIKENKPWYGKVGMFWFSYKQWSIENPEPILGKCWRMAKDEQLHSILD